MSNQTVKEKENAVFTCKLNKENAAGVKWFKGGLEILPNESKYKCKTDGINYSLEILDCQLDDINDYAIFYRGRKCQARLEVEGFKIVLLFYFQKTIYALLAQKTSIFGS